MLRAILAIFGIVASVLSFALQNPPEEVFSAAAKWLRVLGLDQVPAWVADPRADWWLSVAFGAAALAAFATLAHLWLRERRQCLAASRDEISLRDSPPPPRDMTACDAVAYIGLESSWGRKRGLGSLSFEAAREIRQAALEGRLQMWGYQARGALLPEPVEVVWYAIPPSDWRDHRIALTQCDNPRAGGGATESAAELGMDVTPYTHLMASRAQVERLWPRRCAR